MLLFRHFETVNGLRDPLLGQAAQFALSRLTADRIARFAEETKLAPIWTILGKKFFVGGSDDRGGIYHGRAWTEVDAASSPQEFLGAVREGSCRPAARGAVRSSWPTASTA